ncbi:MAG: CBS domain-containing protein [Candidatus Thorarchaeota archaeon]|nr:MAG: CBS domain-containing protein [Candidatus Thorarchaeota archaeon]
MSSKKGILKRREVLKKRARDQIHFMRKSANISQEELADRVGVSQSYIARIESGRVDPRHSVVLMILEALSDQEKKVCADIMTPNPVTIGAREVVNSAIRIMRRRSFSQLPVVRGRQVIGLVTELDIIRNLGLDLGEVTVEAIMSQGGVPTVDEKTPIDSVSDLLEQYQAIAVVKQGRLTGIISRSDLIRSGV